MTLLPSVSRVVSQKKKKKSTFYITEIHLLLPGLIVHAIPIYECVRPKLFLKYMNWQWHITQIQI